MFRRKTLPLCRNLVLALAVTGSVRSLHAATSTWTGSTGTPGWSTVIGGTITNWSPNAVPSSTADIDFTNITGISTVDLQAVTRTVNSLTFGSLLGYTLTDGSLNITTGNITVASTGIATTTSHAINVPITLGATGTIDDGSLTVLTLSGGITDTTGNFGLNKTGSGTLAFTGTGNNSLFTLTTGGGLVDINGATLNIRDTDGTQYDTSLASCMTIRNGGKLNLGANGLSNFQINGGASNLLTVDGAGSQITGANLLTLGNSGSAGSMHITNGASIGNVSAVTVGGLDTGNVACVATIDNASTVSVGTFAIGAIANSIGNATFTGTNTTLQTGNLFIGGFNDGQFGGIGTLTVSNSASVTVTGTTKFYTSASSMLVDHASFSTVGLTAASGINPIIQLNGSTLTISDSTTTSFDFPGTITDGSSAPGSLLKSGSGNQTLSGHNTYTGGTTVLAGTLTLGTDGALAPTGNITVGLATLNLNGHSQAAGTVALNGGTISGARSALFPTILNLQSGLISVPTFVSGGVAKSTTGTATISSFLSAGSITVSAGTLILNQGASVSNTQVTAGTLQFQGTLTSNLTTSSGTTVTLLDDATISGNSTIAGILNVANFTLISDSSAPFSVGTLNLSSAGTVSADAGLTLTTAIHAGGTIKSVISGASTTAITATGNLTLGDLSKPSAFSSFSGALNVNTFQVNILGSGVTTLGNSTALAGGTLSSANGLIIPSSGILSGFGTVTGSITSNGSIFANGGTLDFTGPVTATHFNGNIELDNLYLLGTAPATATFTSNLTLTSFSQLVVHAAGSTTGNFDHLTIGGNLALAGTLIFQNQNNFTPLPGTTFDIATAAAITGNTTVVNQTGFPGLILTPSKTATDLLVTATAKFNGDANLDGVVDIKDLQTLAIHWQQSGTNWLSADFDGNGKVDLLDLQAIANHWQAGVSGGGSGQSFNDALSLVGSVNGSGTAVPEPTSLSLLTLAAPLLLRRRK